ncbi:MAG: hypothetical protein CMJ81_16620 [Planctomycetaceae bacterium]|nr:hypothetical protein [Planctomycetaceae bacterium]
MTTLERNATNSANRHWAYRDAFCEPLEQRYLLAAWIEPLVTSAISTLPEHLAAADSMVASMRTVSGSFATADSSATGLVSGDSRNPDNAITSHHRDSRGLPQAGQLPPLVPREIYHLVPGDAASDLPPDAMYPSFNWGDADSRVERFQADDGERWSGTATDGGGLNQGDPTTLTWNFVADGTWILGSTGEPASASNLISFLDGIYGNVTPDNNYTDESWFVPFNSYLNRWGELSGLSYVYEPNDDAREIPSAYPGIVGTRADLRIGGHSIDGEIGSNTLAYNFFPDYGDMVIDTDNLAFYSDLSGDSLNLRNTLAHEHGHGIGLSHVCPQLSGPDGRLMEPFDNDSIDGPQFDDILAAQRLYGDALENSGGNDTAATAHFLGTLAASATLEIGSAANEARVTPDETDFISIDDWSDTDFFSFTSTEPLAVTLLLTPHGPTYLSGPQYSNDICSPGVFFDSSAQSDLALAILNTNGGTPLETADAGATGDTETITRMLTAGTYYVRITGAHNAAQMYELQLNATSGVNQTPLITSDGGGEAAYITVPENQAVITDVETSDDFDNEFDGLVYSLAGGADQLQFSLDVSTGVLGFKTPPDFETPTDVNADNDYEVRVAVTDSGDLYDIQHITVTVGDVLENDFGDAPDTGPGTGAGNYQTLASDDGPQHAVVAGLFLGDTVDVETGILQNIPADADDFHGVFPGDEDGVLNPLDLSAALGAAPAVTLRVTNTTDQSATLSGWIDYNRDGLFDNSSERALTAVAAGTTDEQVALIFPPISATSTGSTYVRFRLSTDGAAQDPVGFAADGEVEDYVFTMTDPTGGTLLSSTKIASGLGGGPALQTWDFFGSSLTALGDLDADGVGDLVVGAHGDDTGRISAGAVHVLMMNTDGTAKSSTKIASDTGGGPTLDTWNYFGRSVAALGDLDGDGVPDLAVGAERDDTGGLWRGAVFVLLMKPDGTAKSVTKIASGTGGGPALSDRDGFGHSLAGLGDLDGDGVADLAVGADGDDTGGFWRGAVHVLLMKPDGTAKSTIKIASGSGGGPSLSTGDRFGSSVAAIGDLDGDAVIDLAVGAQGDDGAGSDRGAVHVLLMKPDGTAKSSTRIASGDGPTVSNFDGFGSSVAAPGDLNGDDVVDLVVGALGDDTGGSDRGAVHVLLMNPDGTANSSARIASDDVPTVADFDEFGSSVAALGDLNGDGVTDLAVGAPGDGSVGNDKSGAVHVLFLDGGLVDIVPPTVSLLTRDNGDGSHDTLDALTVTFSEAVNVSASALSLRNDTTGGTAVDLSEVSFDYDVNDFQAHWDFTGVAGMDAAFYTAVLDATLVTDASGNQFDGDSNGTAGDHFQHTLLVAKKGDSDTDGDVDLSDYQTLATNFHPVSSAGPFFWLDGNFDGDNDIDLTDYTYLAANFDPAGYGSPTLASLAHAADIISAYTPSKEMRAGVQARVYGTTSPFSLVAGSHGTDESSDVQPRITRDQTASHRAVFAHYERLRRSFGTMATADAELDDADWPLLDNFKRHETERVAELFGNGGRNRPHRANNRLAQHNI